MMAETIGEYPAVVVAEPVDPYYNEQQAEPQQRKSSKKSSKKRSRGSVRHIELMEWLPTLPQFFAYIGLTQSLMMFWVFVGVCAKESAATWLLIMMWITVLFTTVIYFVYNLLLAKLHVIHSITSTFFAFFVHLFLFEYPIARSTRYGITRAEIAILLAFRGLVMLVVVALYSLAYREDLLSGPKKEEEEVYTNGATVTD